MQAYYEKILLKKEQSGICWDLLFFKKGSGMTQGNVYLSAVFGLDYYSIWKYGSGVRD